MMRAAFIGISLFLISNTAQAHVVVSPIISTPGKTETYTFSVPTEGKSPTTEVELEVPDEMTILSVNAPPAGYTLTKSGDRIVKVTWHVNIAAGRGQELVLVAKNPDTRQFGVYWKIHQRFADGTSASWADPMPARPAPTTRISP